MNDIFHIITTWSSSLIILIMGGLLLSVGITSKAQWKHLHYGCFCLAISYLILSIASFTESIMELSGKLIPMKSQLVLAVSFFQAMLFTGSSLVLIHPQYLNLKVFKIQLYSIIPLLIIFGISYYCWSSVHPLVFYLTASAYVVQLVYNTFIFRKTFIQSLTQAKIAKSEDTHKRLYYVNKLFFASLGVGITALVYALFSFNRIIAEIFTISYTIYYIVLVFFFVNCSRKNEFALNTDIQQTAVEPAITNDTTIQIAQPVTTIPPDSTPTEVTSEVTHTSPEKYETKAEKRLAAALEQWVKEERYLCPDIPLEEVANELNTDVDSLHDYFLSHKGVLFRTWRVMLRIEKAKKLLEMNPKIKISELQTKVGFSDKSYFFRRFKQVTGKTPNEYRNDLQRM